MVRARLHQRIGACPGAHALACACACARLPADVHTLKWPSDKHKDYNKTLYCFVTVFGLGL